MALSSEAGGHRAQSSFQIHYNVTYSVPLFLKRQYDRTLGGRCELERFEGWATAELTVCSLASHGGGGGGGQKVAVTEGKDDEGRVLWSFETVEGGEYALRRGNRTTCP